ncbi:MAG TPA: substrate-binding domain-containing protein [Acetobacteraceae bacterium]|nr:substrate-binding domain-containing protein [Acetobacteraceae bacterium]
MPDDPRCRPLLLHRRAVMLGPAATLALGAPARGEVLLRVGGTGMALAAMRQIADDFAASDPPATVKVLPSLGTGGGLAAVAAGAVDLALAVRPLNDAELAKGIRSAAYARTPIAFVTHPDVTVPGITLEEVAAILAGRILTWPDGKPVRLIRREPSDADWTMLRSVSPGMAAAVAIALERPGLLTVATDQDNADALERLTGSFGAMSLGQLRAERRRLTPLPLDGTPPSVEALAEQRYSLSRTLYIAWRDPPSAEVARFVAFLQGSQASELLMRLGHIPLAVP